MDCSLPGSSIHVIFQARVLEWGAIAFSESFGRWKHFCLLITVHCCQVKYYLLARLQLWKLNFSSVILHCRFLRNVIQNTFHLLLIKLTLAIGCLIETRKQMILFILQIQGCATTTTKSLQLCPTLCKPIDRSPSGSPDPGILQARTLEWVAISFSSAWKWKVKVKSLSHVRLLATPWTPWDFPGKSTGVGCHCLLRWQTWRAY